MFTPSLRFQCIHLNFKHAIGNGEWNHFIVSNAVTHVRVYVQITDDGMVVVQHHVEHFLTGRVEIHFGKLQYCVK